jgi:hypothetical protein
MMAYGEVAEYLHLFLTSTPLGVSRRDLFNPEESTSRARRIGDWVGLRASREAWQERKVSYPPWESKR